LIVKGVTKKRQQSVYENWTWSEYIPQQPQPKHIQIGWNGIKNPDSSQIAIANWLELMFSISLQPNCTVPMSNIIGRKEEAALLQALFQSLKSEFVAG
jgi:hypothetical protein